MKNDCKIFIKNKLSTDYYNMLYEIVSRDKTKYQIRFLNRKTYYFVECIENHCSHLTEDE